MLSIFQASRYMKCLYKKRKKRKEIIKLYISKVLQKKSKIKKMTVNKKPT